MLNTPPSYNWYLAGLVFKWMLAEGGVEEFARRSAEKARLLYAAIDGSGGFYRNEVAPRVRSRMNVPFFLHDDALTAAFLAQAKEAGLLALKGHRVLGGIRASIYNAMPVEGVRALVRSEEHTSELQSLMRKSYDVFCLKKKKTISSKNDDKLITTHMR